MVTKKYSCTCQESNPGLQCQAHFKNRTTEKRFEQKLRSPLYVTKYSSKAAMILRIVAKYCSTLHEPIRNTTTGGSFCTLTTLSHFWGELHREQRVTERC